MSDIASSGSAALSEEESLALVSWSAIAEPGDGISHALVGVLGAREALEWARLALDDPVGASIELGASADPRLVDRSIAGVERWRQRLTAWDPEPHLERAARIGARVIPRGSPEWPVEMDDLGAGAPYCLWVRGPADIREVWSRSVAIVGSRSSTAYGEHVAATLAAGLADEGWAVVSGGAYGIDARVHKGALAADGTTVAVMAGGVDRLYPEGNAGLLARILDSGAIVAELPPGSAPHRSRFLTRNRIIAASRATVVVEAAYRSGALSTAFHAGELGRPLAAVPGPVTSAGSVGCHRLIRDGAVLVTSPRDILELVEALDASREIEPGEGTPVGRSRRKALAFASAHERQAYDALTRKGVTLGEVAAGAGLSPQEARAALGALLLSGTVEKDGVLWRKAPRGS